MIVYYLFMNNLGIKINYLKTMLVNLLFIQ